MDFGFWIVGLGCKVASIAGVSVGGPSSGSVVAVWAGSRVSVGSGVRASAGWVGLGREGVDVLAVGTVAVGLPSVGVGKLSGSQPHATNAQRKRQRSKAKVGFISE